MSAAYYSYHGQKKEQRIRKLLEELAGLFACVRKNIECYTTPLTMISHIYVSEELERLGFIDFWEQGAFSEAVETLTELPDKILSSLRQYARQSGKGYKESELQLCRSVHAELETALSVHKQEMQAKNKLYRTLPYLMVLSVVLFFT